MTNDEIMQLLNLYEQAIPAWWDEKGAAHEQAQAQTVLNAACSEFDLWSHDDNPPVWKPTMRRVLERLRLDPDATAPVPPLVTSAAHGFNLCKLTVRQLLQHTLHLIAAAKDGIYCGLDQPTIHIHLGVIQACLTFAGVYSMREMAKHTSDPQSVNPQ